MQNYTRYEIEERKYSSNVVVGIYETFNDKRRMTEKRDIIICPTLKKEDGDVHARLMLDYLNGGNVMKIVEDLSKRGFLCEIVTDGWANWQFKDARPDYDTARPMYEKVDQFDSVRRVSWRGCYYYFDNKINKLIQDDTGLYATPGEALNELITFYYEIADDVDPEAFNNPFL